MRTLFPILLVAVGCGTEPGGPGTTEPGPVTPLGEAVPLTQDQYDALAAEGEFFDAGDMDPAAEAERRAQKTEEARKVVEEHLAEYPEDADLFDPEISLVGSELLPDGNILADMVGVGEPVVLQGGDLMVQEGATALQRFLEPENQLGLTELLSRMLPAFCSRLAPSARELASLSVEQLRDRNEAMADCISEFHTFATPFDHDPTEDPQEGPQDQLDPVNTGTCAMGPYTILAGGGSDASSSCGTGPSHSFIRNYAHYASLPPVKDQGNRGSCVSFGTASAIEYAVARREGVRINLSEQDTYSRGKWDFDHEHFGDGLNTVDFLEELADRGTELVYETSWGYNPSPCRQAIGDDDNPFAYLDSCTLYDNDACSESAHQLGLYSAPDGTTVLYRPQKLSDGATVKLDKATVLPGGFLTPQFAAIADAASSAGAGVVMSVTVTRNWNSENMSGGFIGNSDDTVRGGHAVHLVRMIPDSAAPGGGWLVFKNSWGCGWGDAGYGYMTLARAAGVVRAMVIVEPHRDVFNEFPEVDITAPQDGLTEPFTFGFGGGNEITFSASVTDDESDCCDVSWMSNLDGDLGTGNPLTVNLNTPGIHTITASVRDSYGVTDSDVITVVLTNQAPEVEIVRPGQGSGWFRWLGEQVPVGARFALVGDATDPNNLLFPPACADRRWYLDEVPIGTGCDRITQINELGWHQIRHTAEDDQGAVGQAVRWVRIVELGPSSAPWVRILNPPGSDFGMWNYDTITIEAEVVGATLFEPTVQWTLRNTLTNSTYDLGTAPSFQLQPSSLNLNGAYELQVEATDTNGTSIDTVPLSVVVPPS